jgi:hypothetical protein
MLSNLPPLLQEWIITLNDKNVPMHIRYNYFSMINNSIKELQAAATKFEKEMEKQNRR